MRSPDVLAAFGDVSAVPTMLIYGPEAVQTITRALARR